MGETKEPVNIVKNEATKSEKTSKPGITPEVEETTTARKAAVAETEETTRLTETITTIGLRHQGDQGNTPKGGPQDGGIDRTTQRNPRE